jgi:RNA polymerase sigma-70 factor (ECF subfamily)
LSRFADAQDLLEYLKPSDGYCCEADKIYAALVEAVQVGGDDEVLARALVWLGLWPRISKTFRRRRRDFRDSIDELFSEIGFHLCRTIKRIDLSGVTRLANTIVLNLERDVRDGLKRQWVEEARYIDLPGFEETRGDRRPLLDDRELPVDATDLPAVHEWLGGIVGEDAILVIGVVFYRYDLHELADRLGISHAAARKRHQRAIERLRAWFAQQQEKTVSQLAREGRVSPPRRPKGQKGR